MHAELFLISIPAGKSSWPELVGVKGEVAAETIKRENPLITNVEIVTEGSPVTSDYASNRVRVVVDKSCIVVKTPVIG